LWRRTRALLLRRSGYSAIISRTVLAQVPEPMVLNAPRLVFKDISILPK
jgi:hypothetical protein